MMKTVKSKKASGRRYILELSERQRQKRASAHVHRLIGVACDLHLETAVRARRPQELRDRRQHDPGIARLRLRLLREKANERDF